MSARKLNLLRVFIVILSFTFLLFAHSESAFTEESVIDFSGHKWQVKSGPAGPQAIVFKDDFSGTVIDTSKWTTRTPCGYPNYPYDDCSDYASVTQNESLQLTVNRGNYVWAEAISVMTFDDTVISTECEVWQDEVSSWQDWPFHLEAPIGAIGYYNFGWHWSAAWRNGNGEFSRQTGLPMPTMQPWQHFKLKIQVSGNELQWLYDLGDGAGYQKAFSTTDFSFPFYDLHAPPEEIGKIRLRCSDERTTYVDNVIVKSLNEWSDSPQNVWKDAEGQLHLKITHGNDAWQCAEVISEDSFGYGLYIFELASKVDELGAGTTAGLFTYVDGHDGYDEIDIEFSRWGNPSEENNGQYVIWPSKNQGNTHSFNIELSGNYSTHAFWWREIAGKKAVSFASVEGVRPFFSKLIEFWNTRSPDIPTPDIEKVHINLWINDKSYAQEDELVVKRFIFWPIP